MRQSWKENYFRYKSFFLNILRIYNSKPNLKIYLELMLSITTIIIFSLFAIKPTALTIIDVFKQIEAKETTLEKLNKKLRNLQTASSEIQKLAADMSYISQAVPSDPKPDSLIKQFESLATLNSLKILGISVSDVSLVGKPQIKKSKPGQNTGGAQEVPFSISVSGSYQGIVGFLMGLENLRIPIKTDGMIVNVSISDQNRTLVLTISGRSPYINNHENQ